MTRNIKDNALSYDLAIILTFSKLYGDLIKYLCCFNTCRNKFKEVIVNLKLFAQPSKMVKKP